MRAADSAGEKRESAPSPAAAVFSAWAADSVPPGDIQRLTELQADVHHNLRSANEELAEFLQHSAEEHGRLAGRFAGHVHTLQHVHNGLQGIFRRVRTLRTKILQQHPELAAVAADVDAAREAAIETAREGALVSATEEDNIGSRLEALHVGDDGTVAAQHSGSEVAGRQS